MNKSVSNGVHQPSAMDKNLNTDCTDDTDLTFSLIFFSWLMGIGFVFGFLGFASACGTPFYLANDSANDLRIKTKINTRCLVKDIER